MAINVSEIDPKILSELTIVLTESCNLNCSYCQQKFSNKNLNFEDFKKIIDQIDFNLLQNNLVIELFGGEPIQEKNYDLIKNIIEYFKKNFPKSKKHLLYFKINTNAVYISPEFLLLFKDINLNFHLNLKISFDGLWQEKRSNFDQSIRIIENIKQYFLTCYASQIKLSFSYSGNELNNDNYAIVKNYLYLRKIFPVSNESITYYLIREPWLWTEEKVNNYIKNFKNFCNWSLNELLNGSKIEPFYFKKFKDYSNTLGCGLGISRFTILPESRISACSLDNDFEIENKIELEKIYENCKDCEIFNYCDKTCPKKIFYRNENNKNLLCELKKKEYQIYKKYKNRKEAL